MYDAPAEFREELPVEREDEFRIHFGGEVHGGVVAEEDLAPVSDSPVAPETSGNARKFGEPAAHESFVGFRHQLQERLDQFGMIIKFHEDSAAPDHLRHIDRSLEVGVVVTHVLPDFGIMFQLFFVECGGFKDFRSESAVEIRYSGIEEAADSIRAVRKRNRGGQCVM